MNYAELVDLVQDYLQTTEATFVANIPRFVKQAEERITRSFVIPELRKNATSITVAGDAYLIRPTDFRLPFSLAVVDGSGAYSYLLPKDVNFMRSAYPDPSVTGLPKYYASFDGQDASDNGHFILAPTPDAIYTTQLSYYFDPPSIVDSSTSWLGDKAESALLYGTLVEAYTYNKGEQDLLQLYAARYEEALQHLVKMGMLTNIDAYKNNMLGYY